MNRLETYAVDVLRKLEQLDSANEFPTVKSVINDYYKYLIPSSFADKITTFLESKDWVFSVMEGNVQIKEPGSLYLAQTVTDQYILDRIFEYLKKVSTPETIQTIFQKLQFIIEEEDSKIYESKMINSGLVETSDVGYYKAYNLSPYGVSVLEQYDKYSEYKHAQTIIPTTMSDINELSVLKAFYDHTSLTWPDFSLKDIFRDSHSGTQRAILLSSVIDALSNKRLIDLTTKVPPTWQLSSKGKELFFELSTRECEREISQNNYLAFPRFLRNNLNFEKNTVLESEIKMRLLESGQYIEEKTKGENNYIRRNPAYTGATKISHNTITAGKISNSNVGQDSDFRDSSPTRYPNQNIPKNDKPTNQVVGSLIKFWRLISENKLISSVLSALILLAIYYLFKLKSQ